MKKLIFAVFLLFDCVLHAQPNLVPVSGYCLNSILGWIPVAASLGSSSPTNPPQMALYGQNAGKWYGLACDTNGNLIAGGGTATNLSGGVLGSVPYQSAPSATSFVSPNTSTTPQIYVQTGTGSAGASPSWLTPSGDVSMDSSGAFTVATNPSTFFFINPASSYMGTPDGSFAKPFKSLATACVAATQSQPYVFMYEPNGTDGFNGSSVTCSTTPTQVTVFGNGSKLNVFSGTLTFTIPVFSSYDLNVTGSTMFTATGGRSFINGGSVNGSTTVSASTIISYNGTIFSGANVINVSNGTSGNLTKVQFNNVTFNAGQIVSGGAYTQVGLGLGTTMTTAISQPNINMSAGGQLVVGAGVKLTNGGSGANINCADGATSTAPNVIGDSVQMNNGISCGSAYTLVSANTIIPSIYSSTATQTIPQSGENVVAYSATPTFSTYFAQNIITLTGNVTSSTLASGAAGQTMQIIICQDSSGSHTFVWPSNWRGGITIGSTASKCSVQSANWSPTESAWMALSVGITNE
jgi:hypothetical protein